ncbi:MAG: 8-oxo-dGTP diphosphatase MutT [Polyangiales bacterium]
MPSVVAAAVIVADGNVLLTKRRDDQHLGGMWEFPGGKLEAGESPEQALVRECREECGIEIEVGSIIDVAFHRYPDKDILLLFYRCAHIAGDVQHLQVADHAWVGRDRLDQYELPPADVGVVARVRSMLNTPSA